MAPEIRPKTILDERESGDKQAAEDTVDDDGFLHAGQLVECTGQDSAAFRS